MADGIDFDDERSDRARARLESGLKSCRKLVDWYRALLTAAGNRFGGAAGGTKTEPAGEATEHASADSE
jgi:hypothetical protein